MSNNKTVPSAEDILMKKIELFNSTANDFYKIAFNKKEIKHFTDAMHEHTRLHIEAMRDGVDFDLMTLEDTIKGSNGDLITKIRGKLTDYISKIK